MKSPEILKIRKIEKCDLVSKCCLKDENKNLRLTLIIGGWVRLKI
jgi:hypothetical protein